MISNVTHSTKKIFSIKGIFRVKVRFFKKVLGKTNSSKNMQKRPHQFAAVWEGRFCIFLDELILSSTFFKKTDFSRKVFQTFLTSFKIVLKINGMRSLDILWIVILHGIRVQSAKHQCTAHSKTLMHPGTTMCGPGIPSQSFYYISCWNIGKFYKNIHNCESCIVLTRQKLVDKWPHLLFCEVKGKYSEVIKNEGKTAVFQKTKPPTQNIK